MTAGPNDNSTPDEWRSPEKIRQRAVIMQKLRELIREDDPIVRKRLTHELMLKITEMIQENKEMKKELIAFLRRLKGD